MTSSASEDEQDMQEELWQHLSAYLDEQIEENEKSKKKKKKSSKDATSKKECLLSKNARTPTEQVMRTVGRIAQLTSEIKKQKQLSTELSKQQQNITDKMREVLSRQSISERSKVAFAGDEDGSEESDYSEECENSGSSGCSDEMQDDEWEMEGGDNAWNDDYDGKNDIMSSPAAETNTQLEKFKQALGIADLDLRQTQGNDSEHSGVVTEERVKTIALCRGQKSRPPPEVIVFEDKPSKNERKKTNAASEFDEGRSSEPGQGQDGPEFDLHKARFEVRKFGISGLQGAQREAGMVDLLLKLGAKPPKREYLNYKELQQKKKEEKAEAAAKREMDRRLGFKIVKANNKRRRQRDRNDIGFVDGQVGSYHKGVQVIPKKDIEQLTKKQRRK